MVVSKRDMFPDGREFVGIGISPDVSVHPTLQDLLKGTDPVLQKGIDASGIGPYIIRKSIRLDLTHQMGRMTTYRLLEMLTGSEQVYDQEARATARDLERRIPTLLLITRKTVNPDKITPSWAVITMMCWGMSNSSSTMTTSYGLISVNMNRRFGR